MADPVVGKGTTPSNGGPGDPARRTRGGRGSPSEPFLRAIRPGDLLLVAIVVALSLSLWGGFRLASPSVAAGAEVLHDGDVLLSFTASDLRKDATYALESEGYRYVLRTGGGGIRFESADCPDQVCVRTGWLFRPPSVSACVPGHLLIRILGASGDVDVVSG